MLFSDNKGKVIERTLKVKFDYKHKEEAKPKKIVIVTKKKKDVAV